MVCPLAGPAVTCPADRSQISAAGVSADAANWQRARSGRFGLCEWYTVVADLEILKKEMLKNNLCISSKNFIRQTTGTELRSGKSPAAGTAAARINAGTAADGSKITNLLHGVFAPAFRAFLFIALGIGYQFVEACSAILTFVIVQRHFFCSWCFITVEIRVKPGILNFRVSIVHFRERELLYRLTNWLCAIQPSFFW